MFSLVENIINSLSKNIEYIKIISIELYFHYTYTGYSIIKHIRATSLVHKHLEKDISSHLLGSQTLYMPNNHK